LSDADAALLQPFSAASSQLQDAIYDRLRQGQIDLAERVCAVCDELHERKECQPYRLDKLSGTVLTRMKERLARPGDVNPLLASQYEVSAQWVDDVRKALLLPFKGLWLSSAGFEMHSFRGVSELVPSICICDSCYSSLKAKGSTPPRLAIANNLAIGTLPVDLQDLTEGELLMMSGAVPSPSIVAYRGGAKTYLRSHVIHYHGGLPSGLLSSKVLPRLLNPADNTTSYSVVILGPHTPAQLAAVARRHRVRPSKLSAFFRFLTECNPSFRDYKFVETDLNLNEHAVPSDVLLVREDLADAAKQADLVLDAVSTPAEVATFQAPTEADETAVRSEEVCMYEGEKVLDELNGDAAAQSTLLMRPSSAFYDDLSKASDIWYQAYPQLFPFASGGPQEKRKTPLSRAAYFQHVLRLSHRRFAKNPRFVLHAWNVEARQQGMTAAHIKCTQLSEAQMLSIAELRPDELQQQLEFQEACSAATKRGVC
jgi:hypothetical protein